jgi:hypothetical protein
MRRKNTKVINFKTGGKVSSIKVAALFSSETQNFQLICMQSDYTIARFAHTQSITQPLANCLGLKDMQSS